MYAYLSPRDADEVVLDLHQSGVICHRLHSDAREMGCLCEVEEGSPEKGQSSDLMDLFISEAEHTANRWVKAQQARGRNNLLNTRPTVCR